jgi:hypothetical protein
MQCTRPCPHIGSLCRRGESSGAGWCSPELCRCCGLQRESWFSTAGLHTPTTRAGVHSERGMSNSASQQRGYVLGRLQRASQGRSRGSSHTRRFTDVSQSRNMSYRPGKTSERAKSFKKLQGDDEARRKRGEHLVEIRKTKRTEELQKKRREGEVEQTGESSGFPESTTSTCGHGWMSGGWRWPAASSAWPLGTRCATSAPLVATPRRRRTSGAASTAWIDTQPKSCHPRLHLHLRRLCHCAPCSCCAGRGHCT